MLSLIKADLDRRDGSCLTLIQRWIPQNGKNRKLGRRVTGDGQMQGLSRVTLGMRLLGLARVGQMVHVESPHGESQRSGRQR